MAVLANGSADKAIAFGGEHIKDVTRAQIIAAFEKAKAQNNPNVVLIIGTNDWTKNSADFQKAYQQLINMINDIRNSDPAAKGKNFYLGGMFPMGDYFTNFEKAKNTLTKRKISVSDAIKDVEAKNDFISNTAKANGFGFVDYYHALGTNGYYKPEIQIGRVDRDMYLHPGSRAIQAVNNKVFSGGTITQSNTSASTSDVSSTTQETPATITEYLREILSNKRSVFIDMKHLDSVPSFVLEHVKELFCGSKTASNDDLRKAVEAVQSGYVKNTDGKQIKLKSDGILGIRTLMAKLQQKYTWGDSFQILGTTFTIPGIEFFKGLERNGFDWSQGDGYDEVEAEESNRANNPSNNGVSLRPFVLTGTDDQINSSIEQWAKTNNWKSGQSFFRMNVGDGYGAAIGPRLSEEYLRDLFARNGITNPDFWINLVRKESNFYVLAARTRTQSEAEAENSHFRAEQSFGFIQINNLSDPAYFAKYKDRPWEAFYPSNLLEYAMRHKHFGNVAQAQTHYRTSYAKLGAGN
jgi:hypothetical protein